MFSDVKSFVFKLNLKQRLRFINFLESLKEDGNTIAYSRSGNRDRDITIDELIVDIQQTTEWEEIRSFKELVASLEQTAEPKDEWGVHETHCCSKHGCKYGDEDCPVVLDLIKQRYPCEWCNDNRYNY